MRAPLVLTECRICGELHEEVEYPHLTMNQPYLAPQPPAVNYADDEEDTIRVKSLADMVFPNPPENAGQARGYINQVLMSIGKLQKTPGNEIYQWAQECLTNDEAVLQADPRYPRTDREIASRLIKTCKRGRFGLGWCEGLASNQVSTCGRVPKPRDGFGGLHWHGIDGVRIISRAIGSDLWDYDSCHTSSSFGRGFTTFTKCSRRSPLYLLVSEWRNAHDLALHALYA